MLTLNPKPLGFRAYGDVKAEAIGQGLWAVVYYGYMNFCQGCVTKGFGATSCMRRMG